MNILTDVWQGRRVKACTCRVWPASCWEHCKHIFRATCMMQNEGVCMLTQPRGNATQGLILHQAASVQPVQECKASMLL